MFRSFLSYKALLNGTTIVKVDKLYPSSKLCHICGYKKIDLTLNNRVWTCPICNTTHNRDYNAAINILKEGLRLLNINDNNCISDNSIIYNTTNPWAKGDSSLNLNSIEFLSEKHPLQTSNS